MSSVFAMLAACAAADVQLLRISCSGSIELLPDQEVGLTIDLPRHRKALDQMYDTFRSRLRCHCSELTNEEIAARYDPVEVVLNLLSGTPDSEKALDCIDDTALYTRDLHKWLKAQFSGSAISVPDTCTAAAYRSGEGCRFTLRTQPELSADLSVSVERCSTDSVVPSLGIWCRGEACDTLFRTCSGENGCSAGQQCVEFLSAANAHFGDAEAIGTTALQLFFGLNTTSAWDHLTNALGSHFTTKCEAMADTSIAGIFSRFADYLTGASPKGVCLPKDWNGVGNAAQEYYQRGWEQLTGPSRTDECSPFVPRKDSQFNWRRGQITDYGQSGGGWCHGFAHCNFHQNAGDCESDDDFEYFMAKLYCKYKNQQRCLEYAPFCIWDPKTQDKHKCVFNYTTQKDGIDHDADWTHGLTCDSHAQRCGQDELPRCEKEYCLCRGGTYDGETEECDVPSSPTCPDLLPCWGQKLQCYEKSGEQKLQQNAKACEEHFMCECIETAKQHGCDAKEFCGRRCACMHTDKDRFVGAYCDVRLNRGEGPVLLTYNPDMPAPILGWDGKLSDGTAATKALNGPTITPPQPTAASSGVSALAVTTCDGQVWFLPGSPVGFYAHFRGLGQFAAAVADELAALTKCVTGNADPHEVERSLMPHMPAMWIDWLVGDKGSFPPASIADYLFNASGTTEADEPDPHVMIALAQWHQFFTLPPPIQETGLGLHGMIYSSLNSALRSLWGSFTVSLRALGWIGIDTWYYALYQTQQDQNEESRREKVREIVMEQQQKLMDRQREFTSRFSKGRIAEPEAGESVSDVYRTKGLAGLRFNMEEGGQAVLHAQRCPAGGLAAYQVGVTEPLASNFKMKQRCTTDSDCDAEGAGRCVRLDARVLDTHLYGADFTAGFLWGGNFTKGFIGGCPIMSTTISMNDLSTTAAVCIKGDAWPRDVASNIVRLTERVPSEYDSCEGESCLFRWCYSNPHTSAVKAFEAGSEDGVFKGVEAAHDAPFVVESKPLPAKKLQAASGEQRLKKLAELKKQKAAAAEAEDYDEAKRLKKLISDLENQKDEL